MMQTQVSLNQETLPPILPDQDNFDDPDPDLDEGYEEENDSDSEDFYQDDEEEEETEDFPLVYYNLPTKKPDPKQQKLRAEKLQERNQHLLEKKEQARHHPIQPLSFLQSSESSHVSFKKLNKLTRFSAQARLVCYISDKNLLVILLQDGKTVNVYNTLNFKLVTVAKSKKEVTCMSYCQKLGRIIVAGACEFIQLWSPKTFEVEAECLHIRRYQAIFSVAYVAKSNVIVAKTPDQIHVYNTGLRFMTSLSIPCCAGAWYSSATDIFSLSKNLFMAACHYGTQKGLILFNIKTGNRVECSKTAYIPITTSIEMTEKSPVNVFSCLGLFNNKPIGLVDDKHLHPLIQFTVDTKNEELVPVRSSDVWVQTFSKLHRIKNSKYFLAERFDNYSSWKTCLLSINKDQIEILRVISGPTAMVLNKCNSYRMLKDGLSVVEVNERNLISVYRSVVHRDKPKDKLEDSS